MMSGALAHTAACSATPATTATHMPWAVARDACGPGHSLVHQVAGLSGLSKLKTWSTHTFLGK